MTADGRPPRRKSKPLLSEEDRALWEHVARSVARRPKAKPRLPDSAAVMAPEPETSATIDRRLRDGVAAAPAGGQPGRHASPSPPALPARAKSPPLADFDRKAVRRIRSGRIEIDARLDLHGMRQDEAHRALVGFLAGSHARGLKWVLVITGKGRATRDGFGSDAALHGGGETGVLRRNVPRWLAEPDLRPIVVSYTTAAIHHGGEGALYIQLRAHRHQPHR